MVETRLVKLATGIAMRVDMYHAQSLLCTQRFHDRVGDGMVAAYRQRKHALRCNVPVPLLQVFYAHRQAVTTAKRHIAYIADAQRMDRRHLEHMVVRSDALDSTKCARAKARAGPIARTQVHGCAHQRHLQVTKIRRLGVYRKCRR